MSKPSERLKELGLSLPPVAQPVGAYVPALRHGDQIILSGQVPLVSGKVTYTGKVGSDASIEDAQDAARICALNALSAAAEEAGGVDRITRVLKVVVYVAAAPGFTEPHKVANGASNFFAEVFGDAGKHARAAVGVAELPLGALVEVDATFVVAG